MVRLMAKGRPVRTWLTSMPRVNRPEQTRTKATRSRWLGSMFAWILKTKPEKWSLSASIVPVVLCRGRGAGARSTNRSRNGSRPKLVIALPKKTGESLPARNASLSNGVPAVSRRAISSQQLLVAALAEAGAHVGVVEAAGPRGGHALAAVHALETQHLAALAIVDPEKPGPEPTGQLMGAQGMPRTFSISSSSSSGGRPRRSILLMKVVIGTPRIRQTWNSLIVWGSTPLTLSMSMTAESAAARVR